MENKRKTSIDELNSKYGIIPPQAIEIEQIVLGAYILEKDTFALYPVAPEIFYKEEHQKICRAIASMSSANKKIDLLTVCQKLHDDNILDEVGGAVYITTQLLGRIASAAHIDAHIAILKEKFYRREIIRLSNDLRNGAYDESIDFNDVIEQGQSIFMSVLGDEENGIQSFKQIAKQVIDRIGLNMDSVGDNGIPTGYSKYDKHTYGLHGSDLLVIAGETSNGKTSLALNIIKNVAENDYPCAYYSLEMGSEQLVAKLMAINSGIPSKEMLYNKMHIEQYQHIERTVCKMNDIPIYFDDKISSNINKICASIRRMVLKYGVRVVVVDYLQLVTGNKLGTRELEVGENSRIFKNLAKELDICIIELSQLSRNKENPIPTLSRLRDSGQIEESADTVILIWIPEISDKFWIKKNGEDIDVRGKAEVIVAKGRNVGLTSFFLNWDKFIGKLENIEESIFAPENQGANTDFENDRY